MGGSMAESKNLQIIRDMYDAYNRRDLNTAVRNTDRNTELTIIPQNITLRGTDNIRKYFEMWSTGFPDSRIEIKNLFGEDNWVVCEYIGRGTNTGILKLPEGDIMPTNKKSELRYCDLFTIRNEKISNCRTYFDLATMLHQLELMPELRHH
jgi:ketosteroid isomerase-like protein